MIPLASETVAVKLPELFTESNKSRYQHIASQIDSTLGENEVGLLLVSERHQIQFPDDIEVFYVSPPALDEFRRWLQNWAARQQATAETPTTEASEEPEETGGEADVDVSDDPSDDSEFSDDGQQETISKP